MKNRSKLTMVLDFGQDASTREAWSPDFKCLCDKIENYRGDTFYKDSKPDEDGFYTIIDPIYGDGGYKTGMYSIPHETNKEWTWCGRAISDKDDFIVFEFFQLDKRPFSVVGRTTLLEDTRKTMKTS